jgi:HD superfamily phosphohydrolase
LRPQSDGRRFFLSRKALSATEAYVFARFHMYRTVYFHKTTRAAEVMLSLLFQRIKDLLGPSPDEAEVAKLVPGAPRAVLTAFAGQIPLAWYIKLDEHTITEFLKGCGESLDPVIKELGVGLIDRQLYKVVDATGVSSARVGAFTAAVQNHLQNDPHAKYLFAIDNPSDTPYKPYDPDAEKPAKQIFVEIATGKPQEISFLSKTVLQLRDQYELVRYYFPARLRSALEEIARNTLWKE